MVGVRGLGENCQVVLDKVGSGSQVVVIGTIQVSRIFMVQRSDSKDSSTVDVYTRGQALYQGCSRWLEFNGC